MVVISDTSPISNLIMIDRLTLLKQLFQQVIIPPSVHQEILAMTNFGMDLSEYQSSNWIDIQMPKHEAEVLLLKEELDDGESEAIVLAKELVLWELSNRPYQARTFFRGARKKNRA